MQNYKHYRISPRKGTSRGIPATILLVLITFIFSCTPRLETWNEHNHQYTIGAGADTVQDAAIIQLTSSYRDSLNSVMNEPLIFSKTPLTRELPEGNLGNLCADIWFKAARELCQAQHLPSPQIAVFNHGGLRSSLPSGVITIRNVFELMPFENELVICELPESARDSLSAIIARKGGAPISGFRMKISSNIVKETEWPQSNPDEKFYVVTSDYLAGGNDNFTIFKSGKTTTLQVKLRDVLINEFKKSGQRNDTLSVTKDGRISNL